MSYTAAAARYESMPYRRCGRSGLKLPAITLGLWHNFGGTTPLETLTTREREVLKLVAQGLGNKEVAKLLNLSIKTVEKHRANVMHKLGLKNVAMLTAYAISNGLLNP